MFLLFNQLNQYPKDGTPQEYRNFIEKVIKGLKMEREMWEPFCCWSQPVNAISLQARVRIIFTTQLIGDGEEYLKTLPFAAKEMAKQKLKRKT